MATVLKFGEPPATPGGDFERACAKSLAQNLPDDYTLITNLTLPTHQSNFYEMDLVVASQAGHEILECKFIRPVARVGEDYIEGTGGYFVDNAFSTLSNKCKVLESRLKKPPFFGYEGAHPISRIIVPDDCELDFLEKQHRDNQKVLRLGDYLRLVRKQPLTPAARSNVRARWIEHRTKYQAPTERRDGRLGRFSIKRRLEAAGDRVAYLAVDEPPCKVDVHLLEIPFPQDMPAAQLEAYLAKATRPMAALRRLRHPLIHCVTGHFCTGSSLVQISDWFDGETLPTLTRNQTLSVEDKTLLMTRVAEALIYCHRQNVFHRNIHPSNVLTAGDCNNIQLTGFECVRDPLQDQTVTLEELRKRDVRVVPPEEIQNASNIDYRLYDIFQAGVLFYWILEDGRWPFPSTFDYITGEGLLDFQAIADSRYEPLQRLITSMLAIDSRRRPDMFTSVLADLQQIA